MVRKGLECFVMNWNYSLARIGVLLQGFLSIIPIKATADTNGREVSWEQIATTKETCDFDEKNVFASKIVDNLEECEDLANQWKELGRNFFYDNTKRCTVFKNCDKKGLFMDNPGTTYEYAGGAKWMVVSKSDSSCSSGDGNLVKTIDNYFTLCGIIATEMSDVNFIFHSSSPDLPENVTSRCFFFKTCNLETGDVPIISGRTFKKIIGVE